MLEGHILKFISSQQSNARQSKKFHPQQTYGYSKQSPDWFKRKFSLQDNNSYEYKFDNSKFKQKFQYISQKHSFRTNNQQDTNNEQRVMGKNALHNRKKGLLSEYLDNNSGMKSIGPLNGFQRNQEGRRLNIQERNRNIETIRMEKSAYISSKTATNFYSTSRSGASSSLNSRHVYTNYQNRFSKVKDDEMNPQNMTLTIIPSQKSQYKSTRSKSIAFSIGQKQKIRQERNKQSFNKLHKIEKVKFQNTLLNKKMRLIDSQLIKNTMTLTARQWSKGRNISPTKSIQRFDSLIREKRNKLKIKGLHPTMQRKSPQFTFQRQGFQEYQKFESDEL